MGEGHPRQHSAQPGAEPYQPGVDDLQHPGMENDVGNLDARQDNLPEQPGRIHDESQHVAEPVPSRAAVEQQIMAEEGNEATADDPHAQVKKVEHSRKQNPEDQHDGKSDGPFHGAPCFQAIFAVKMKAVLREVSGYHKY